jgi:multiple sugar transport system substrate-binding protein
MNKKILALAVVFVVLLVVLLIILANRKSGSGTGVTPTPPTGGQVTLIWWNLFEPQQNIQPLIDAFEKENPNIKIQYAQVGLQGIDQYKNELEETLTDEEIVTSPDIFPIHNTWVGKFQKYLVKAPASVINTSTDLEDFYDIVKRDFYRSQSLYGLPMSLDTIAIIYNKTRLKDKGYQAPALTWTDLKAQAIDLTKKDEFNNMSYAGFSAFDPETSEFYFEVMNLLFMQNGVIMISGEDEKSTIADNDLAKSAFDYYRDYLDGRENTWDPKFKKDIAAFLEDNLAMYPATTWRLINVLQYNEYYNLNLDIGVAAMPQLTGGGDYYWPTYWGLSVAQDTQYASEAWKFIKFLTKAESLQLYNDTVKANGRPIGIIYPRLSLATKNLEDTYLSPYATSLAKAQDWDMMDGWALKKEFDSIFSTHPELDAIQGAINKVRTEAKLTPTPN